MLKGQVREDSKAQGSAPNCDVSKKRITCMLYNPTVIKRALWMLLPVCFKYFKLMFIHC